jgi:hypothetical protein
MRAGDILERVLITISANAHYSSYGGAAPCFTHELLCGCGLHRLCCGYFSYHVRVHPGEIERGNLVRGTTVVAGVEQSDGGP